MSILNRWTAAALCVFALPALYARESVCLNTGFCLTADSHTVEGQTYILHTGEGTMQFPSNQISEITILPDLPGAPPPSAQTWRQDRNSQFGRFL